MDLKFYVDRQFIGAIFINVVDGVVTGIVGNGPIERKMEEEYLGKAIWYLKVDFEKRMQPTYHCVMCVEWANLRSCINTRESNIIQCNRKLSDHRTIESDKEKIREIIFRFENEISEFKIKIEEIEKYLDSIQFTYVKTKRLTGSW